jgi:Zn-dependent protease
MRDPMNWALPLFRAFGIPVKVHIFFFVVTVGLCLRHIHVLPQVWWVDIVLLDVVALFGIILLHEFGHCFGARHVGGEAHEILIWPLGGLATNDIPHTPRALFVTVAAGPGVNVLICLACAAAMAAAGYLPSLNPFRNPYTAEVYNYREDRVEASRYGSATGLMDRMKEAIKESLPPDVAKTITPEALTEAAVKAGWGLPEAPGWVVWAYRVFWLSWVLFLFNLIPAYPLDGGQLLQSAVWARTDYRRGVVVAAYSGFVVAVLALVVSFWWNEAMIVALAMFMLYMASLKLYQLDADDGPFGYDFSAGYTSLDRDEEAAPKVKRPGPVARWLQARKARKLQREMEQRAADEERKELLLEKIAQTGMTSLTAEERRFLEQFSSRYRHKS